LAPFTIDTILWKAWRRALDQLAALPDTPALRRQRITLQVALIPPLGQVKGFAASETKAAVEQARLMLEQAEVLGEPPEDPLLLFSVLYGSWVASFVAFNGDVTRELAAQFLTLAEKRTTPVPLMIGHRLMGTSLLFTGDFAESRTHFDDALALFNPAEHRWLAARFSQDHKVGVLLYRSTALGMLGYPEAGLADADHAIKEAREIDQAVSLMAGLAITSMSHMHCGNYATANAQIDEVVKLAGEKGTLFWKVGATLVRGSLLAVTGKAADAVRTITSGLREYRATGATVWMPTYLSYLAIAHTNLGELDDASRCVGEAISTIEATKERWYEAEANRIAGEIALRSPEPNPTKSQDYLERALAVARQQQAKSWQLRASMSLARLWRDQGKSQQAREMLAPVYGWFTEGFETRDLKEAKALLEDLHA
jgi:predicted ATPase